MPPRTMHIIVTLLLIASATATTRAQILEEWVTGLAKPIGMTFDPADNQRVFIVEQDGLVRVVEQGKLLNKPFIEVDRDDFTDRKSNWERGLLGLALDPGYADNKRFYLYYTDKAGDSVLSRFTANSPNTADWSTEQVLLRIDQPYGNHNGGCIRFGPDGMLYIGPGDGGAANDPRGAGQRLDTHLGKLLRIDVTGEPDEPLPYAIPDDNPFVETEGAKPDIWAYGLRNPWRFEFDSKGRLWIADVGQNRFEEINLQQADSKGGENYGWNAMEGMGTFKQGSKKRQDPDRLTTAEHLDKGFVPPVFEYRHHPIGSITGGFFYEGSKLKWLKNRYICADFMSGRVWSFRLSKRNGFEVSNDVAEHTGTVGASFGGNGPALAISGFGLSPDGETLYILDHNAGRVLRFTK